MQSHHHSSSVKQINVVQTVQQINVVQTVRESKTGHYTQSLFYWTNVVCHFPVLFRRACGRSAEWDALIRQASLCTNSADQLYNHFTEKVEMAALTPSYTTNNFNQGTALREHIHTIYILRF